MRDYLTIGSTPADEPCAQVGAGKPTQRFINWNRAMFARLEAAYAQAVADRAATFVLTNVDTNGDAEFVTSYAKYLIEYLKPKFK